MTAGMGQSFTYDGANRLKTAGNGNSSFGYDGDGTRVKKTENGANTFYVKSSVLGQTAMEVSSTGVMRAFVYSGGKLVAMQATDGQFYWLHTNHLGNARTMTDTSGNVAYGGQFDPYGQTLAEWSATGNTALNTKKFTGYERDAATGLDYAQARMYNNARGRFTSPDPIGLKAADLKKPESLNLYGYVRNDPLNFVDPNGNLLAFWVCNFVRRFVWDDTWWDLYECHVETYGGGGYGHGIGPNDDTQETAEERRQRRLRDREQKGIDEAADMLKGDCAQFVRDVIQLAALKRGNTAPNGSLYPVILPNQGGELALNAYIQARNDGRVSASNQSGAVTLPDGTQRITYGITTNFSDVQWNNEFYDLSDRDRGFHTLHESLHQIPGFTDSILAQAAKDLTGGPSIGGDSSLYFNERLRTKCR